MYYLYTLFVFLILNMYTYKATLNIKIYHLKNLYNIKVKLENIIKHH